MPRRTIADLAADLLTANGPQPLEAIVEHVVAEGGTKAKDPKKAVLNAIEYALQVARLPGGRYASMDALRQGRVFTHRITEEELSSGRLVTAADLWSLRLPLHEPIPSNRGELRIVVERGQLRERPLTGPTGWLADLDPGDLVAVRYDGSSLDISPVGEVTSEPFVDRRLNTAIGAGLAAAREWDEQPDMPIAFQVHGILADDPTAFTRPGLPLSERFPKYEVHGNLVGYPGTDWSEVDWWDAMDEDDEDEDEEGDEEDLDVAAMYQLTGAAAAALRTLVVHVEDLELGGPQPDERQARRLAQLLGQVAAPFRAWCQLEGDPVSVIRLGQLLAEHGDSPTRGIAWSVVATGWEELGDHGAAEEAIARAVLANPSDDAAQLVAARYASDRGDAAAAMAHLRAAGIPANDPEMQRLRPFAEPPASTVGRNAPCPCGSGKKHKQCCLRDAQHPLAARAPWLWHKLATWTREPRQRDATLTVAQSFEPDDLMAALQRALHDPITADLALWGFDLVPEFIDNRGGALPADELELLKTWVHEPLRVVEVIEVAPGRLTLIDRETDETFTARDKALSGQVGPGEVLATRLLPNGAGEHLISFVIEVPPIQRSYLTAALREGASPERAVAGWFISANRPPEMVDREGNELVVCTGTWSVPDAAAAEALLDGQGTLYDGDRKVGAAALEGNELEVTCLSRELWTAAVELIEKALPDGVLLRSDALPASDVLAGDFAPMTRARPDEPMTPETAYALRQYMEAYERSWVDESIPALEGLTPREALQDPVRRRDLMHLLDDMPDHPNGMSADRIRGLLGLT